ncbi:Ribonuclease [Neorhodopirellula pilleata]|uniref:Ribonuclease n=2 Tax=Neorhodopirellula pilleata TaxID=2714738 RepID=A0A5C6A8F3_9BACT|nr:Ribonuclease [Neorhodopirellula pilleata]
MPVNFRMSEILQTTPRGLYCPAGGFYIDPTQSVDRAVITHGHSDHARWGCRHYLAARPGETILRMRLTKEAAGSRADTTEAGHTATSLSDDPEFEFLDYGETRTVGGVKISLHPAGHMLGSAQVRLEYRGRVAVVSGDYKLQSDSTCQHFESVSCDLFVTESTFGLPIYRWNEDHEIFAEINAWWRQSSEAGKCCLLYAYAVGKSQRLLAGLDPTIGPIYTHGAVEKGVQAYRTAGVELPETTYVGDQPKGHDWAGAMVIAVPSAHGTPWMRKFGNVSTAMASGWMAIRGARRRRAVDRGFVLSDHVDWPGLMSAVKQSRAKEVWVTHGSTAVVARYLNEQGIDARPIDGHWQHRVEEDD